MTILVTGGAGYIGSHTCADLLENGHQVVVVDDYSNSSPDCLGAVREVAGRPVVAHLADIRRRQDLDRVFEQHEIDAVIHFAARKSVPESVRVPLDYYDVNVNGTRTLLSAMVAHDVRRFIFSSSCSIYGDQYSRPITEDDTPAPTNPYARSKLVCEQMLADMSASQDDFSVLSLRYFNPVGAHPSGALGESPRGNSDGLMPRVTSVAAGRLRSLQVSGGDYETPDGSAIRDYIHVMDVAEVHRVALGHLNDQAGQVSLNVGTGAGVSVLQFIEAFSEACGVPVPYEMASRRPGDVASLTADPTRIAREWGWRASRNIQQMCEDAWRFQRLHPDGYASRGRKPQESRT